MQLIVSKRILKSNHDVVVQRKQCPTNSACPLTLLATAPRRVICNCFDVSAEAIATEIIAGSNLIALQEKLKCGTSCGSCLSEVKRMLVKSEVTMAGKAHG